MSQIISAAAFVRRHWTACGDWPKRTLVHWVWWFSQRGYVAVTRDGEGRLSGIGMARPVATAEQACGDYYHHDDAGPGIFMDLLIARNPEAMLTLWRELKSRFGMRNWIAMQRLKYKGRLIIHPMARYDIKMEAQHGRR